jgi:hypothetical protein
MSTSVATNDPRRDVIRRRNRKLALILIAVMLGMAVWGTLYLRYYGLNLDPHSERYH